MDQLAKPELFYLLEKSRLTATNHEMQQAYEAFIKKVETLNQSETDYQTIFRKLSITRIEFKTLQTHILCEQGGKCT